ncbi:unnamed protein product [Hermetia illucens]|uniref:Mannosyltransferase n=1 Tax=Hermetia illucens TaxID=343691 RepID=A0A7R8V4V1_HERIL|nr:unnamed protein product [Hermetia illucens]
MAPSVRHRLNSIKSDSTSGSVKKLAKKSSKEHNASKKSQNSTSSYPLNSSQVNTIVPGVDTAFKAFLSARFCSAIWAYITDCDETFNYWEPLHYMIYGHGLQTWEYSPQFALRSYTYLMVHAVPAWVYNKIFEPSPLLVFYFVRCMLGLGCAVVECYLYKAISREFGIHIGRLWLIFQLFSVGMFISSTALLPSSFSMYFTGAAMAAWWHQKYTLAVFFIAISALLGWPFAALLGVPIALDMLFRRKMLKTFVIWAAISDHGPNLYGVAPLSYYLINGFLNFNIVWLFALMTPVMLVIDYFFVPAKSKSTLNYPHYLSLAPLYIWLAVFFIQPHKEERFLFPIYPLISLCGAITTDIIQKLYFRVKDLVLRMRNGSHYLDHTMFVAFVVMIATTLLSMSRIFALYRNYHAPMDLLMELNTFKSSTSFRNEQIYNICIGKDWYRYPTSFFLPSRNFRIRFLKSEFDGMLPAYYSDEENATAIVHDYFNDMNREDMRTYFDYQKCHFLLDLDLGRYTELEPNYAAKTKEWTMMKSFPFLNAERSHQIFRAFYIPFVSDNFIQYGSFNLLKRKRLKFR